MQLELSAWLMRIENDPEIVRAIPKFPKLLLTIGIVAACVGIATYPLTFFLEQHTDILITFGYISTATAVVIFFGEGFWYFVYYWIKKVKRD